jgi:hypothetical protein
MSRSVRCNGRILARRVLQSGVLFWRFFRQFVAVLLEFFPELRKLAAGWSLVALNARHPSLLSILRRCSGATRINHGHGACDCSRSCSAANKTEG